MNKRRLLKLAKLLEADAKNKNGVQFDLTVIAVKSGQFQTDFAPNERPGVDCGTAACAIGLACISGAFRCAGLSYTIIRGRGLLPKVNGRRVYFDRTYSIFGLTEYEGNLLFQPRSYSSEMKGAAGERAVANRIRDFVAGRALFLGRH